LEVDGSGRISVEVDKPEGITIDECVKIQKSI
jgi:ribosome maturation factor RimP